MSALIITEKNQSEELSLVGVDILVLECIPTHYNTHFNIAANVQQGKLTQIRRGKQCDANVLQNFIIDLQAAFHLNFIDVHIDYNEDSSDEEASSGSKGKARASSPAPGFFEPSLVFDSDMSDRNNGVRVSSSDASSSHSSHTCSQGNRM